MESRFAVAVDVGLGIEMTKSEIYGPALERAHFLESCKARYPRIAVGDDLLNYLRIVHGQSPSTVFGRSAVVLAGACLSAIFQDSDGCLPSTTWGAPSKSMSERMLFDLSSSGRHSTSPTTNERSGPLQVTTNWPTAMGVFLPIYGAVPRSGASPMRAVPPNQPPCSGPGALA